jgi:anti-sigma factor (TIGR02949 family)
LDCLDVREQLLDFQQGRLAPDLVTSVRRHLDGCGDCAHADQVERELTQVLERRTPQHPAPVALKRKLAANWPTPAPVVPRGRARSWPRLFLPPVVLATAALLFLVPDMRGLVAPKGPAASVMIGEAVNDHVRLLQSERPLEVESGGIHQVIPWFSGKLDFAPGIRFAGDAEFPLRGGAVGYFVDRKAAALVYGRRLHSISLFVFKADGLPWPSAPLEPAGRAHVYRTAARGFNVLLWRDGELGYALVSDVSAGDLMLLASKLAPPA